MTHHEPGLVVAAGRDGGRGKEGGSERGGREGGMLVTVLEEGGHWRVANHIWQI